MFQDMSCMCPFGIGVFFQNPGNICVCGGGSHVPPNPNSSKEGFQNDHGTGGMATHCLGIGEQLHFIHQYLQNALVSLDSCSSRWVMGNYLYKKNQWDNVVQPWSDWKMLVSLSSRVVERDCESRLSSLDSPLSNFHRCHLAFICSLGSLIINQIQAAFKHIFRQPACTNRTKLSNLSVRLVTMISFAT